MNLPYAKVAAAHLKLLFCTGIRHGICYDYSALPNNSKPLCRFDPRCYGYSYKMIAFGQQNPPFRSHHHPPLHFPAGKCIGVNGLQEQESGRPMDGRSVKTCLSRVIFFCCVWQAHGWQILGGRQVVGTGN